MHEFELDRQLDRLRTQWPHSYGPERVAIIWKAFQMESANVFRDAVTELIANSRSAPMLDDLTKAVQQTKAGENQRALYDRFSSTSQSISGIIAQAAARGDSEYGRLCAGHVGKINSMLVKGPHGSAKLSEEWCRTAREISSMADLIRPPKVVHHPVARAAYKESDGC